MTIALQQLDFAYGDLPVLADVTVEAGPGRVTALIGPNAAGKSTLLRCAIGALRPHAGAARIDGVPAAHLAGRRLATRLAYVGQRSPVAAAFTVREVVELGRYALGASTTRVRTAITRLGLRHVEHRPYPALSVGQQQRVALARALAQLEPAASLVLDEPTAAMDLAHARDCFSLLRELADEGHTVIVAMHDLASAAAVADDVWILAPAPAPGSAPGNAPGNDARSTPAVVPGRAPAGVAGPSRIRAAGPVDEVMEADRLRDVFGVDFEWVTRADGEPVLLADTRPARPV